VKLLIATTNPGKISEYRWIFESSNTPRLRGIQIFTPSDFDIAGGPEESGETFTENAMLKAKFYCERAGIPALGDDAGIEIDVLGGEPGVKTRRWLGHDCTDEELISYCLERLKGVPKAKRGAQFRAVATLVFPDGKVIKGEGTQRGHITETQIKELIPGYPFRSIFIRDNKKVPEDYLWEGHYSHRKVAVDKIINQFHGRI